MTSIAAWAALLLGISIGVSAASPETPGRSSIDCKLENVRPMETRDISAWWPAWTPDSRAVLFTDFNNRKDLIDPLYLADITKGKTRLLTSEVDITAGVGFSPKDGTSLSLRNSWRVKSKNRKWRQIINLKSGESQPDTKNQSEAWVPTKLAKEREGRKKFSVYELSQDDENKFFLRDSQFYFQKGASKEQPIPLTLPGKVLNSDWLPGKTALVIDVAAMSTESEGQVEASELFLIDLERSITTQLTDSASITEYSPKVSPNGKHVAFLDYKIGQEKNNTLFVGDLKCK